MNGEPLPKSHGGPLRMVVAGYIGARSTKWLIRLNILPEVSCFFRFPRFLTIFKDF